MEEQVYLVKTVDEAQRLWNQLKSEHWESAIVCIHEDLFNLDVKRRIFLQMYKAQIEDIDLHLVEPSTVFLRVSTSAGGGLTLNYYMQMENLTFERGMHALSLSYMEETEKGSGLGGLLGGIARSASGQSYLQMLIKNQPGVRVDTNRIVVDLDQWQSFQRVSGWIYEGKTIGRDLRIENMGIVNRCLCLRFQWTV